MEILNVIQLLPDVRVHLSDSRQIVIHDIKTRQLKSKSKHIKSWRGSETSLRWRETSAARKLLNKSSKQCLCVCASSHHPVETQLYVIETSLFHGSLLSLPSSCGEPKLSSSEKNVITQRVENCIDDLEPIQTPKVRLGRSHSFSPSETFKCFCPTLIPQRTCALMVH